MDAADQVTDLQQGVDRVVGAVEDQVGRVEVDEQVVALDVCNEIEQVFGRFLAGLEIQLLVVAGHVIEQFASDSDQAGVTVATAIFGDEPDVQCDGVAAQQRGEVADLLHFLHTSGSSLFGHQPHRGGRRGNVGVAFAFESTKHGCHGDARIGTATKKLGSRFRVAGVRMRGMNLHAGDAEFGGDVQVDSETSIDRREDSDRPLRLGRLGTGGTRGTHLKHSAEDWSCCDCLVLAGHDSTAAGWLATRPHLPMQNFENTWSSMSSV